MKKAQHFCLLLIVLSCGGSLCAQQKDCNKPIVPVAARDKHDNFVSGLQKGDFQANVRGKGVDILSAATGIAQRVVAVLDISGSMSLKCRRLPDLLRALFRVSPEGTQFSVIVFGERVLEKIEFWALPTGNSVDDRSICCKTGDLARDPRTKTGGAGFASWRLRSAPTGTGGRFHHHATDERDDDSKMSGKTLGKQV